jgi:hypothetical protein
VNPQAKSTLALVLALATAAAVFFVARRSSRGRVHAIDAIPANAFLVLKVDVDGLRRSPLGAPIFGGATSKLSGEKTFTELCGFDPLSRMSEVAVGVPEDGAPGEFGVSIRAEISKDDLLACAQKVIESRKGHGLGAPTVRASGSYTLVESESDDTDPTRRTPTLAYRDGGPFLIARGPWLATMIDTVDGKLPSVRTESPHAALRHAVGETDASPLTVIATAVLPKALRERLKNEMGIELGSIEDADAGKGAVMAGVLGVASVGVGISAGAAETTATLIGRCDDPPSCAEVQKLVRKKRLEWLQDLSIGLFGLRPLLDAMTIDNDGGTLRVTTGVPSDDASKWLDRILTSRGFHRPMPSPLTSARPPRLEPASRPPDEVLYPPKTPPETSNKRPGAPALPSKASSNPTAPSTPPQTPP